jgi:hypothetical protein
MSPANARKQANARARTYRERMRAKGLRQVTVWAIDTRSPEFAAEAARQSRLTDQEPGLEEDMAFLEACAADWGPWDDDSA